MHGNIQMDIAPHKNRISNFEIVAVIFLINLSFATVVKPNFPLN